MGCLMGNLLESKGQRSWNFEVLGWEKSTVPAAGERKENRLSFAFCVLSQPKPIRWCHSHGARFSAWFTAQSPLETSSHACPEVIFYPNSLFLKIAMLTTKINYHILFLLSLKIQLLIWGFYNASIRTVSFATDATLHHPNIDVMLFIQIKILSNFSCNFFFASWVICF